jgi:HPr kinase/phosphorylase
MNGIGHRAPGIHATAVVYNGLGVLVRGPSGSGKSALALALIAHARDIGAFGALVGDDRVWARAAGGRLVASGSPMLAGLIERRGVGLMSAPHEPATVIELIVELSACGEFPPRLPDEPDVAVIEGIGLPRLVLDSGRNVSDHLLAVDERIRMIAARKKRKRNFA